MLPASLQSLKERAASAELREKLDRRCHERGTKVKFEVRRALELYLEKD